MVAMDRGSDHLVERVRTLCMAFPQTQERPSHGEACWFVAGKRMFVMFADHHHDDRVAFWAAADDGVQRHLVEQLVEEAWRCIAGPRLIKDWAARR